jgi:ABC-type uncharacterized transport system substrate-binding protein
MAKDEVFGLQRGPRSEQPDQGAPDQSAKIAHRSDYQPIRERQSAVWVCGRDTLYVVGDPLMNLNRIRINTFALAARLPTMYVQREYVETGGLMSYGPNYPDLNRRAADYVDKILRGTKPGDIPVEQPTKFDLIINLITAKAIGVAIPSMLLARADEVIE